MDETSERHYYLDENGLQTLWAIINARFEALEKKLNDEYMRTPKLLDDTTLPDPEAESTDPNRIYLIKEEEMDLYPQFYEFSDEHDLLRKKVVKELPSPEEAEPNTIYLLQEEQFEPMYETSVEEGEVDYSDKYRDPDEDDGTSKTVNERITEAINTLDATVNSANTVEDESDLVKVTVTQENGKITGVEVDNKDASIPVEDIISIFNS